ncbi:hypothetical protein Megpolyxen_01899 (plasmid) [Candidatus Megaera polyxenophila]|nr:hypothetical protein Megpolyxen_01899 [Candidatus Megaera polyxenophila]
MFEYRKYMAALDNRRREIEKEVDSKSPFDAGVMRAIEASKKSLALDTDQEHRAIRKGLHMFSDALTKQYGDPRFRERDGTLGKVASLGPAISAGLEGYEAEGEKIQHDMREVLEVARKFRDSEIKRLREQDKDAFDAYFKDKQLGLYYEKLLEQERYHQGKLKNSGVNSNLGLEFIPFEKPIESKPYRIDKTAFGTNLSKIKGIKAQHAAFRNKTKDNIADPMGPFSAITNPVKDAIGKYADSKVLRDETADRKTLNSNVNEFIIQTENALRGGGVLGPKLIQVFKDMNIYPNLDHDTPEDFERKLARIEEETQKYYDTANYALKYGIHLDPSELENFKKRYLHEEEEPVDAIANVTSESEPVMPSGLVDVTPRNNSIRLYNPETNQYFSVPENDLPEVMRDYPNLIRK